MCSTIDVIFYGTCGLMVVAAIAVFVACTIADNKTFRENDRHGGGLIL